MKTPRVVRLFAVLLVVLGGAQSAAPEFSGTAALEFARKAVSFGPRPAGSEALGRLRAYIHAELKPLGCEVTDDAFTASTPHGPVPMTNIIARFRGTSGRTVAISGHYDTKQIPATRFVGANDGGSSTGFLLEMARVVARMPHKNTISLVWFDGEEAFEEWSDTDGTYGSRHLAGKWAADGTLAKLTALINVDMIGDRELDVADEWNSTESLRQMVRDAASRLALSRFFITEPNAVSDDHIPFLRAGARAVDLIDFNYGPDNTWWHTDKDTMDKLSASSLRTVGAVVVEVIRKLEP